MLRRLAVLLALALSMSATPAEAEDDGDYGGGVAIWVSTDKALKHRSADGCNPEEFVVRMEMPALVIESGDYHYRGPLMLDGVGGGLPCWWGESGGWVEFHDPVHRCWFTGVWFDFRWNVTSTLVVSLYGNCGRKQLQLVAKMMTTPGRAVGPVVVSNCY